MGIEANGDIKGCPSLPSDRWVGGNSRERSLQEVLGESRRSFDLMRDAVLALSDEELRFLETVGHQICLAVERARHQLTERARNREARGLAAITKAIGGQVDPGARPRARADPRRKVPPSVRARPSTGPLQRRLRGRQHRLLVERRRRHGRPDPGKLRRARAGPPLRPPPGEDPRLGRRAGARHAHPLLRRGQSHLPPHSAPIYIPHCPHQSLHLSSRIPISLYSTRRSVAPH